LGNEPRADYDVVTLRSNIDADRIHQARRYWRPSVRERQKVPTLD
jgi:hypothetical protein